MSFALGLRRTLKRVTSFPDQGGCRKLRWGAPGRGKRRGVRVIYFNRLDSGVIWLLVIYAKAVRGNIPAQVLKAIKQEIEDGQE